MWKDSGLEPMKCETTSSVKECALRARSSDVHVARVVSLVVDAVVGLTLGLIAHVVVVVFVVAILHRIFLYGRKTLLEQSFVPKVLSLLSCTETHWEILGQICFPVPIWRIQPQRQVSSSPHDQIVDTCSNPERVSRPYPQQLVQEYETLDRKTKATVQREPR